MSYQICPEASELGALPLALRERHIAAVRQAMRRGPSTLREKIVRARGSSRGRRLLQRRLQANYRLVPDDRRLPILRTANLPPDGLGFSLKPPKFVRRAFKAVKRAVTIKNVAKAAAIVGGAVILGPAALKLAKAGGSATGNLIRKLGSGAAKLVSSGRELQQAIASDTQTVFPAPPDFAPGAPAGSMIPQAMPQLGPMIAQASDANLEAATGMPLTVQTTDPAGDDVEVKPVMDVRARQAAQAAGAVGPIALMVVGALVLGSLARRRAA